MIDTIYFRVYIDDAKFKALTEHCFSLFAFAVIIHNQFFKGDIMIYAVILAAGTGSRMGADMPKQFLELNKKPIIIHTIEKFAANPDIDMILAVTHKNWLIYTKDLIKKYLPDTKRIRVIPGGSSRTKSLTNAILHIEDTDKAPEKAYLITHDAARPFVTEKIIGEHVKGYAEKKILNTAINATDTILLSQNGNTVDEIPDRSICYLTQTPQSFMLIDFKKAINNLSENQKADLTDAAKIFVLNDLPVEIIEGDISNIKITFSRDLEKAKAEPPQN